MRFATYSHKPEEIISIKPTPPSAVAQVPSKATETCDRQVATDPVPVSNLECQTSPLHLVSIFTQTEQVVVSKAETISVAVQSSPELKSDCCVQTEVIPVNSIAVGTLPEPIIFTKGMLQNKSCVLNSQV